MQLFTANDTLPAHIKGISERQSPYTALEKTAILMRDITGTYAEGSAYRLIVTLRPELRGWLTNFMNKMGKDWRNAYQTEDSGPIENNPVGLLPRS